MKGPIELPVGVKDILSADDLENLKKLKFLRGNVYGKKGKTLLHYVAKYSNDVEILKHCVNTLKVSPKTATKRGKSLPLHVSCKFGKHSFVKFLLSGSTDLLESKDAVGETALSLATQKNYTELVIFLHQQGASVISSNKQAWTPLHYASKNGNFVLVDYFLQLGANASLRNNSAENSLHLSVESGCINTVNLLLQRVFVLEPSAKGTVIHHSFGKPEMTCYLLENTQWAMFPKLAILLDISAPVYIFMKYCLHELQGQALYEILKRDRDDLVKELYFRGSLSGEFIASLAQLNLKPKCTKVIQNLSRWQNVKKILFVYKNKTNCINRLPDSLIREIISHI